MIRLRNVWWALVASGLGVLVGGLLLLARESLPGEGDGCP
jgi:hypothetical protein